MYLNTNKIKDAISQEITRQLTDQGGSSVDVDFVSNSFQGKVSAGMISVSVAKNCDEHAGEFYFEELNERTVWPIANS